MAHHIWCNFFSRPENGCQSCERLRRLYPENIPPMEMMEKYFPEAVVIPGTSLCDGCDPIKNPKCSLCLGS